MIANVSTPAGIVRVRNRTPLALNSRSVYETVVSVRMLLKRATPNRSKLAVETSVLPLDRRAKNPVVSNGTPLDCTHRTVSLLKIGPVINARGRALAFKRTMRDMPPSGKGGLGRLT